MKSFSKRSQEFESIYSFLEPNNEFFITHEKGNARCLEHGNYLDESILMFCPKQPDKKLLCLIDDFIDNQKHVILIEFKNSADVMAAYFRIKTSYPLSIYSFRDNNKTTHYTLNIINIQCVYFNPTPASRIKQIPNSAE